MDAIAEHSKKLTLRIILRSTPSTYAYKAFQAQNKHYLLIKKVKLAISISLPSVMDEWSSVSLTVLMHTFNVFKYDTFGSLIFKPGARQPQAGVRLVSRNHFHAAKVCVCVCVCVCVHPRGYK